MFDKLPNKKATEGKKAGPSRREFLKTLGLASLGAVIHGSVFDFVQARSAREQQHILRLESRLLVEKFDPKDWADYKNIIATSGVRENLAYIDRKFGDFAYSVTKDAKFPLEKFDALLDVERKGGDISTNPEAKSALTDYEFFYSLEKAQARGRLIMERAKSTPPSVTGFEQVKDLTNKALLEKLKWIFGEAWVYGAVDKITYYDRKENVKTFRVAGDAREREIRIFKIPFINHFDQLPRILSHEIAHEHDWERSAVLTTPERLQFIREITEAFESHDRYKDPYVEKDIPKEYKGQDPAFIEMQQLYEFWATINEAHDFGDRLKKYQTEEQLVIRWRKLIKSRLPTA